MTVHQKGEGRCPNVLACSLSHFQAVLMVLWCLYWTKEWLFSFLICPPFSCISCVYSSCVLIGILAESWSSSPNADPLAWIKAGNPLKKKKRVQRQKGRFTEIGCCLRILTFSEKKKSVGGFEGARPSVEEESWRVTIWSSHWPEPVGEHRKCRCIISAPCGGHCKCAMNRKQLQALKHL